MATVNSEPITEEDLIYSLKIAHRREDLSSGGKLNLTQFVQKLIDDRLIVQEARNMGMEKYPEVKQSIQAYILRESVMRLHDEEIAQKISVTEEEIMSYYKKNYERFSLGIIQVSSEEDAQKIIDQLKTGSDFKELAQKYSVHPSKKNGGEVLFTRNTLSPHLEKNIINLKQGDVSDAIRLANNYYIVKLVNRKEAPDEELEGVRAGIDRSIRKRKERERGDEYLKYLREKATIKIDHELLSDIKLSAESEKMEKLENNDERILIQVNGSTLTVRDFVAIATSNPRKSKEEILNSWIDHKIIDHEALSRHYEKTYNLKNMSYRYENQLLKNIFIKKVIVPQIAISDKTLEEYYSNHQEIFVKPERFKIQQITVKTMDDAQDILHNLQRGADFSWLAKKRSIDFARQKGGNIGWFTKVEMHESVRKIIDTLKPGDISPIVIINSQYRIIRLQDKKESQIEEFIKVKSAVYRVFLNEQIHTLLKEYIAQLKIDSEITISEEVVQSLEEKLQK